MAKEEANKALEEYINKEYGVDVAKITHIKNGITNTNYIVLTDDNKYIFKIYNFKNTEEVGFEVDVLEELKKHDFLSPRISVRVDGGVLGKFDTKPSLMYEYIEGETIPNWNDELIESVGEYMGRMHLLLRDLDIKSKYKLFDYDLTKKLVKIEGHKFLQANFPDHDKLLDFVKERLSGMSFPDDLPCGITHHDIKPENVIVDGGKLVGVVDFDLSYYGVLLNDMATTIIWSCFPNGELDQRMMNAFLKGYESKRELTKIEQDNFLEAIHFRLVREVFSSPYDVLPNNMDVTKRRSDEFMEITKHYEEHKSKISPKFKKVQ